MEVIDNTIRFVKQQLENAEGGHDWFHIERVYKNSLEINKKENGNPEIVALAALLHDIADHKFVENHEYLIKVPILMVLKTLWKSEHFLIMSKLMLYFPQ